MKKMTILLVTCWLLLSGLSAIAQGDNLLENPGFEAPFDTLDGDPPREVAQGWTPWHIPAADGAPSFSNRQPEYLPTAPDPTRILEGNDAQLITSFFATHDGGVLQNITGISSGTDLRFSVFAYIWSTTFDELDVSDQDGDVFVQVGIDPTGGTDPESDAIVWSEAGVEQYDAYNEYEIEAEAAGDSVTVFVRTTIGVPVKNNNIYLDKASLTSGDEQPDASETPTEAPSETPLPPTDTEVPPTETPEPPTATDVPPSETPEPPTETPTEDNSGQLTATAAVEEATQIAETSEAQTAVANVPSSTPDTGPEMTATAIIIAATGTAEAEQTATAGAVTPSPTATQAPISEEFPGTIIHTVQRGETVAILADRYGSTINAISVANGLNSSYLIHVGQELIIPVRLPAPATSTPTPTSASPGTGSPRPPSTNLDVYIVQRGDTLSRIAQRFNATVGTLAQLNGIVNIDRIQAGQRLLLPGEPTNTSPNPPQPQPTPQTYIVRPGDTLSRISLRFGVPISRIARANNIVNWNWIYAGQRLIIPS